MIDGLGPTYALHPLLASQQRADSYLAEVPCFTWGRDLAEPPEEKPVLPHGPPRDPQTEAKPLHEMPNAGSVTSPPPGRGLHEAAGSSQERCACHHPGFFRASKCQVSPTTRGQISGELCQRAARRTSLAMGVTF